MCLVKSYTYKSGITCFSWWGILQESFLTDRELRLIISIFIWMINNKNVCCFKVSLKINCVVCLSASPSSLSIYFFLQVAIIAGNFELAELIKNHKETDIGK